jgi:hypothetical protein
MKGSETSLVGNASAKNLEGIKKTAWDNPSTSPQEYDSNSIKPTIKRGEEESISGCKGIFSANLGRPAPATLSPAMPGLDKDFLKEPSGI